jgi:hypothetical protein
MQLLVTSHTLMAMDSNFFIALGTWATVICGALAVFWQVTVLRRLTNLQLAETKRLNGLQLFLQLRRDYESQHMQQKRSILANQLHSTPKTMEIDDSVPFFFESLGDLTNKGHVDLDLVWTTFCMDVCLYWFALRHYVQASRNELADNTLFWQFEDLKKKLERHTGWENAAPSSPSSGWLPKM